MKILFVSAVLPYPLYSGGQIRVYNLLQILSRKHTIDLYTFIRHQEELGYLSQLAFCHDVATVYRGRAWQLQYIIRSMSGPYPFVFATYDIARMRERIARAIASTSYDVIHIEPGYVWPSLPTIQTPFVVGEHNIEHAVYEQYANHFPFTPLRPILVQDVRKLKQWEQFVWRRATHITAVSDDDKRCIDNVVGRSNVSVVPNGVNVRHFNFRPKKVGKAPTFLFVGNFAWMQNRDAVGYIVRDIWPLLISAYPNANLLIVGKRPPKYLREIAGSKNIKLSTDVDDIASVFHSSDVLLAPIRIGGGTKYKILEAMACGIPVVTTKIGAMGLNVQHGEEILIAKDSADFVRQSAQLLEHPRWVSVLVKKARKKIEKEFAWDLIAKTLDDVWRRAHETHG